VCRTVPAWLAGVMCLPEVDSYSAQPNEELKPTATPSNLVELFTLSAAA
jgi:hypothetical protein